MSTPQQVLANQANAQLSTGPRTPHGKQKSAQNSTAHGLTASSPDSLTAANQAEFAALAARLRHKPKPSNPFSLAQDHILALGLAKRLNNSQLVKNETTNRERQQSFRP